MIKYKLLTNNNLKAHITGLLLCFSLFLLSQENPYLSFQNQIRELNKNADTILKINNDSLRLALAGENLAILAEILKKPVSYSLNFDSVHKTGFVKSPDKAFRFITYNIPLLNGDNRYFGIIQMNPKKDTVCKLFILNDISIGNPIGLADKTLKNNDWFGALCYNIIPNKIDGKMMYTILGMHYNNLFTNKKVIDLLQFDDNGYPQFGSPVFLYNSKYLYRVIFEYSINVTMILKYDEKLNMLVFDHLSPPSPMYSGNFKFYGPDFSYDGLRYEKGKWLHVSNVNYHK